MKQQHVLLPLNLISGTIMAASHTEHTHAHTHRVVSAQQQSVCVRLMDGELLRSDFMFLLRLYLKEQSVIF